LKLAGARALAWCEKPGDRPPAVLIFGADAGLAAAAAAALIRTRLKDLDPVNVARLSEEDMRRDEARLGDELVARSLLGGERLVRVRIEREAGLKPLLDAIEAIDAGQLAPEALLVVEAGELGRASKLRKAFEDARLSMALHLYPDDEATLADFAAKRLAAAKIEIEADAMAVFLEDLPGDRRLAMSELDKLELFALDLGRPLTLSDIRLIGAAEQPRGADEAADAALAGDTAVADRAIQRFLDGGGGAISALRTLHFRLLRMLDAVASGAGSGMRLRPPVFEKEWPAFARAMRDWTPVRLQRAFDQLYQAERACKRAGAPAEAIVAALILRIARRAL
jgi:DNA polymerase III subunit delta